MVNIRFLVVSGAPKLKTGSFKTNSPIPHCRVECDELLTGSGMVWEFY